MITVAANHRSGSRLQLPRCVRGGSRRLGAGAALVPDDGYRLLLGEPGAGGEHLIEPGCAQPLADLGHQLGPGPGVEQRMVTALHTGLESGSWTAGNRDIADLEEADFGEDCSSPEHLAAPGLLSPTQHRRAQLAGDEPAASRPEAKFAGLCAG